MTRQDRSRITVVDNSPEFLGMPVELLGEDGDGYRVTPMQGEVESFEDIVRTKPKLLIGSHIVFNDGTPDVLVYPCDRAAYGRLCQLLSKGKLRTDFVIKTVGHTFTTQQAVLKRYPLDEFQNCYMAILHLKPCQYERDRYRG